MSVFSHVAYPVSNHDTAVGQAESALFESTVLEYYTLVSIRKIYAISRNLEIGIIGVNIMMPVNRGKHHAGIRTSCPDAGFTGAWPQRGRCGHDCTYLRRSQWLSSRVRDLQR